MISSACVAFIISDELSLTYSLTSHQSILSRPVDYLFKETVDSDDAAGTTRYDQIMDDLKSLLAKYPDYKIFVTGHSLGAALSSVAAFYFACDDDLPKPISCINFWWLRGIPRNSTS